AYCAGNPINRADPTGHVLDKLLPMLTQKSQFGGLDILTLSLHEVERRLGGTQNIIKAAGSVEPQKYMLNLAANDVMESSLRVVAEDIKSIKNGANIEGILAANSAAAITIERYRRVGRDLELLSDQLDEPTLKRLGGWQTQLHSLNDDILKKASNKVGALTGYQSPPTPPPPYSLLDSSASPGDVRNQIRKP
ncbi:MAG: hypothetical protein RR068_19475, partial [Hafnia sp.]